MPGTQRLLLSFLVLGLCLVAGGLDPEAGEKRGSIYGTSNANLRAGPSVNHALKTSLKEGDQVTVEGQEREWYLVTTPGGQKGYVHKNLVKLAQEGESQAASPAPVVTNSTVSEATEPTRADTARAANPTVSAPSDGVTKQPSPRLSSPPKALPPATIPAEQKAPAAKSPSLIQLLEGRETDMVLWSAIAVAFFFIGWICGGNFYLRRDRARRTKLWF